MAGKNKKTKGQFNSDQIRNWENQDGVNFAIALARITGWLLHVDWLTIDQHAKVEDMTPLRVYVGIDSDYIFDFNGKKHIQAYNKYVVTPIAAKRVSNGRGNVATRYYSEELLKSLPLRVRPSETEIQKAHDAIIAHATYLEKIPKRLNPEIPAYDAARFTYGWCTVYAEVIREIKGQPSVAIIVSKYTEEYSLSKIGYCHSINLHPDGEAEDVWGKQPLQYILDRFGVLEYTMDEAMQQKNNLGLKENSPEKYKEVYDLAVSLVRQTN
jgi:hypothetical protein